REDPKAKEIQKQKAKEAKATKKPSEAAVVRVRGAPSPTSTMNMKRWNVCLSYIVAAGASASAGDAAPFELPDLPYAYDALEPSIGAKTLTTHHQKHHKKYVDTANGLIERSDFLKDLSQEDIIRNNKDQVILYNNVAQAWNHHFYWQCMKPDGGGKPGGTLAKEIIRNFGSVADLRKEMKAVALTAFGSGWAWLSYNEKEDNLLVTKTTGAGNPMTDGLYPILTIDVWEHAYYLDYQEKRAAYLDAFFEKLVNWDFAAANLSKAMSEEKEL
ncbi:hypothetical protein ACHAWF_016984, partial [Thalassiosira exigua]